jgi:hypothetical protein
MPNTKNYPIIPESATCISWLRPEQFNITVPQKHVTEALLRRTLPKNLRIVRMARPAVGKTVRYQLQRTDRPDMSQTRWLRPHSAYTVARLFADDHRKAVPSSVWQPPALPGTTPKDLTLAARVRLLEEQVATLTAELRGAVRLLSEGTSKAYQRLLAVLPQPPVQR